MHRFGAYSGERTKTKPHQKRQHIQTPQTVPVSIQLSVHRDYTNRMQLRNILQFHFHIVATTLALILSIAIGYVAALRDA